MLRALRIPQAQFLSALACGYEATWIRAPRGDAVVITNDSGKKIVNIRMFHALLCDGLILCDIGSDLPYGATRPVTIAASGLESLARCMQTKAPPVE